MSYWDVAQMAADNDLLAREQACAAQEELPPDSSPFQWVAEHALDLAASPGWDAAWASAVAGGNAAPGRDPAVITDGMILSAVQALLGVP